MKLRHYVWAASATLAVGLGTAHGQAPSPDVNEDFELNIVERRITEADFQRSLSADLSADRLRLQVGVSASARQIDVTLRGVTGRVSFRASLERIRERIGRIRSTLNSR